MAAEKKLTGVERTFHPDELIVSKTDPTGKITYANDVFITLAGYTEEELLGQPHSIIRHPEMPRAVFKLLWDTIESGAEIFAYVVNRARNGDHYWVFAHVTPNLDAAGTIIGYHSSRRVPRREAIAKVKPLYDAVLAEERRHGDRRLGLERSFAMLVDAVGRSGFESYDRFVLGL
ncbi:MAG: PAS domain-containing protein [Rhodospirillaceae bacterium]